VAKSWHSLPDVKPCTPLLDTCIDLHNLRSLDVISLRQLADELRHELLYITKQTGGHFAAGLGVIELTIALHYVFNTPIDDLIWDVGHQSYPHKILTGRRDQIFSLRQKDGLSGFPKRSESEFDSFGVGHSSTSISAALGMALAKRLANSSSKTVAIIGDGALTAGMAFEALNHAPTTDSDLLVILNDNDMSISPNVGGMSNYLVRILASPAFVSLRENSKKVLSIVPPALHLARKLEESAKSVLSPGLLFEELGWDYFGPINGHNIENLVHILRKVSRIKGSCFLHVCTQKGRGFIPAEKDPIKYHAISAHDADKSVHPTYSQIFGKWLCDMAAVNNKLMAITPAMREGSCMVEFSELYPARYFDVAIAEQHALTLAAGMACKGAKPVVAIYSTFLQRAYDQLIHDIALQDLDVLLAIDRAGVVGEDGATHAGSFDLSFLRCIPNIIIMTPSDENELRLMLTTGFKHQGLCAVRYPRGSGVGLNSADGFDVIDIGKARIIRTGRKIALLVFGTLLNIVNKIADKFSATLVDMRFVKPLDHELLRQLAKEYELIVTIEENVIAGGAGSGVAEYLTSINYLGATLHLGLPDSFVAQGTSAEVLSMYSLDAEGIERQIKNKLSSLELS